MSAKHTPDISDDLIPSDIVQEMIDFWKDKPLMEKGIRYPDNRLYNPKSKEGKGPKSIGPQDYSTTGRFGDYWVKPTPLDPLTIRQVIDQTPILSMVVLDEMRQLSQFGKPQRDFGGFGFVITTADRSQELAADDQRAIRALTGFIDNCGWERDPRKRRRIGRDSFEKFIQKIVCDTLSLDAAAIETEFKLNRSQGMDGFYAVDGATIRLTVDDGYEEDDAVYALQLVDGTIRTAYTYDELIFEPRNPRTDVRFHGYGYSEVELIIKIVTGFLNALNYNLRGFDDSAIPKGILHLTGEYDQAALNAFKRTWNAMTKGVGRAWELPILSSPDPAAKAAFERMGDYSEMHFAKFMTFFASIAFAVYGRSPEEFNFESFSAGRSSLSGSDTAAKIEMGRKTAVLTRLSYVENLINNYILGTFGDRYVLRFTGLDNEQQERAELRKDIMTWNMALREAGYKEREDALGDAPLNPSLLSAWMQMQQPEEGGSDESVEDAPEGVDSEDAPEPEDGDEPQDDGQATGNDDGDPIRKSWTIYEIGPR